MKRKQKKRNPLHAQQCSVCRSPDRERVESDYVSWVAASKICKRYGIKSRTTLYRHVQALALTERRDTNIKGFLRSVIDRGVDEVPIGEFPPPLLVFFETVELNADGTPLNDEDSKNAQP
jgi:hypothetical protein